MGVIRKNKKKKYYFIGSEVPDREVEHKPEDLTCFKCKYRETCPYVDDLYNTDEDCLALK